MKTVEQRKQWFAHTVWAAIVILLIILLMRTGNGASMVCCTCEQAETCQLSSASVELVSENTPNGLCYADRSVSMDWGYPRTYADVKPAKPKSRIEKVMSDMVGTRVVILVDDSGSMGDSQRGFVNAYRRAAQQYGKDIVGVYTFTDTWVRFFPAGTKPQYTCSGNYENTYEALQVATRQQKPDLIILYTDQAGLDWPARGVRAREFPPVIAHCLDEQCAETMRMLVNRVGGKYIGPVVERQATVRHW